MVRTVIQMSGNILRRLWSHKKWLIGVALVVGGVGLVFKDKFTRQEETLTVVNPKIESISQTLEVSGKIQADTKAVLRFQTGGQLSYVGAKEGDVVKKWQTIASLDKTILKKQLQKELNDYLTNRWTFEQGRDNQNITHDNLADYGLSDAVKRTLEQNQFSLNNTVLDVEIQDATNRLASLYAPFGGVLTQASHQVPGVNISVTDTFTIVDPASLYFEAQVDEVDIGKMTASQSAIIKLDAFPDETINTTVESISFTASAGESGGTVYLVKFPLPDNLMTNYRLGMNGDVTVILDQKDRVLTVPINAVIQRDDKTYVKIVTNQKSEEKLIEVGLRSEETIEVVKGLTEYDQIYLP